MKWKKEIIKQGLFLTKLISREIRFRFLSTEDAFQQ